MNEQQRHIVHLEGCTATPLANYLKGLGVFRIVAEQKDPDATAWWEGNTLCLSSRMEDDKIVSFFRDEYRPAPIMAPWNGGSGFHPGEDNSIIEEIIDSTIPRFSLYGEVLKLGWESFSIIDIPNTSKEEFKAGIKEKKTHLLQYLRNNLPHEALRWVDAAVLLGSDNPQYPPLLGTGGNDGRLEFTNNFMQRLASLFYIESGMAKEQCEQLLNCALFSPHTSNLPKKKAIGQFHPGAAGGFNMTSSYEADALNNTWDYVLMIEGALLFAAASTKKMNLDQQDALSYPFCVRTTSAAYGSAAKTDEESSRAELWTPVWRQPANLSELTVLFSEGRVQVDRANAVRGVDFARAIATLGVDRGIHAFQRFGFQERNGLAYLAVDLGQWSVIERHSIALLRECEGWTERFRRTAKGKNAPNSFVTVMRAYDEAVMNACKGEGQIANPLVVLGQIEQTIIHSPKTATDNNLSPLSRLSVEWLDASYDGTPEFRLACALASIQGSAKIGPLRVNMIPYDPAQPWKSYEAALMNKPHVVWKQGNLVDNLIAVLCRRCMDAERLGIGLLPLNGAFPASMQDVLSFIRGEVDEARIEAYLWGLNAVNWRDSSGLPHWNAHDTINRVPPAYALFKLTHATARPDGNIITPNTPGIPYDPAILALATAGRVEATRAAARRLHASGWQTLIDVAAGSPEHLRRCAAAVLFPIRAGALLQIARGVLRLPYTLEVENRAESLSVNE